MPKPGEILTVERVFSPGDIVSVTGTSKGKGFAGVVKRHHFKGGPKTHGQSDRHRAPGSIGQSTTPGRVFKGKRMAGRMGSERVTLQNLTVVDIDQENKKLYIAGLVPGHKNALLFIVRSGENKKFVPLISDKDSEEEGVGETLQASEASEPQNEVEVVKTEEAPIKSEANAQEDIQKEPKTDEDEVKEVTTEDKTDSNSAKPDTEKEVTESNASTEEKIKEEK